jgi:hypothetical protein
MTLEKAKRQLWSKAYQIIMNANNKKEALDCLCSLKNLHTKKYVTKEKANRWISEFWKDRKLNRSRYFC